MRKLFNTAAICIAITLFTLFVYSCTSEDVSKDTAGSATDTAAPYEFEEEPTEPNYKSLGYRVIFRLDPVTEIREDGTLITVYKTVSEQTRNINFKDINELSDNAYENEIDVIGTVEELGNIEGYDERFFEDNVLISVSFIAGSGSYDFYISNIYKGDGRMVIGTSQVLKGPYVDVTDDIRCWRILIEVKRSETEGITEFKSVMDTDHRIYRTRIGELYMQHALILDMNTGEYIFNYFTDQEPQEGKKWYQTIKEYEFNGRFALSDGTLTLKPSAEHGNRLIFDLVGDSLIYNGEKSQPRVELPFGGDTEFKEGYY